MAKAKAKNTKVAAKVAEPLKPVSYGDAGWTQN